MDVKTLLTKNSITYIDKGKSVLIRCLNPEHEDKNPSLNISTTQGIGFCFSCGFKVDVFKHFGVLRDLNSLKVQKLKSKVVSLYKHEPQQYPRGYNLVMKRYRGVSVETLNYFNVFTCQLPEWDGRVWLPVKDIFNNIVVFQGRYIASNLKPKYKFYPEHISPPLFPSNPDTKSGSLIIVEGIFDLLRLWDNGIRNIICGFGLALASKNNKILETYKIMGINTLIPLFDNDEAGNRAIKDFENTYKDTFIIKKYSLPIGKDPADLSIDEISNLKSQLNL